jgi:TolA-binding protein
MNLESNIYELSFELSEFIDKNDLQKLLGVLANDGVYAMWVYAMDKLDWKFSDNVNKMKKMVLFKLLSVISELDKYSLKKLDFDKCLKEIADLTQRLSILEGEIKELQKEKNKEKEQKEQKEEEIKNITKERNQKMNQYFQNLAQDLNKLLFMKELLEKVFIYALYHAKAKGD